MTLCFFDSNGPLTGFKRDLTEGGIRAPLLARWPGTIKAGQVSDLVSAHWDMLPTFCELSGVEVNTEIDGISMVPTLTGKGQQKQHDYLYWEFYERGGKKAARWGEWKAIQRDINKTPNSQIMVFNLSKDVAEQNDLASERPDLVKRAKEIFLEAHTPSPNWSFGKKRKK